MYEYRIKRKIVHGFVTLVAQRRRKVGLLRFWHDVPFAVAIDDGESFDSMMDKAEYTIQRDKARRAA